jgi:hypothetical protein
MDADRDALLRIKRAELRRGARGVAGRVAIFAIDGADWELLSELVADDRLPNIEALIKGGTTATVQSIQPTVSPLVWTSLATGVTPDRHGLIDIVQSGTNLPVDAHSRRVPALWEMSEGFGRSGLVVNWWAAWPPTLASPAVFDTPGELLGNAIHPPALAGHVQSLVVPLPTVGYEHVHRFLNISNTEYESALAAGPANPVSQFRSVLAKTWSDHRVGIHLYNERQPLLLMMGYDGTDAVNHLFGPYHPPYREGISEENYRKYWPTVANYYSEIDRLIGEWMRVLTDDTTVVLVSAYGFQWGKQRPRVQPDGRAALGDHRGSGVFIAYGNHIAPSRGNHTISIYDIVPATLALLGLPASNDMAGQFPAWTFRDITPVNSVRVVSYTEFFNNRTIGGLPRVNAAAYLRDLRAIGHLYDPARALQPVYEEEPATVAQPIAPQQWGSYAWYNNRGIELRKEGKIKEAAEAFDAAIQRNPSRPIPYLNLAMALIDRQQYTAADEVFMQAVAKGLPDADRWIVDFAAYYRANNMISRAIAVLYKGREVFPQS